MRRDGGGEEDGLCGSDEAPPTQVCLCLVRTANCQSRAWRSPVLGNPSTEALSNAAGQKHAPQRSHSSWQMTAHGRTIRSRQASPNGCESACDRRRDWVEQR